MGEWKQLTASDRHTLSAYQAAPAGSPVGAVVVIQEIFGVNPHIRSVVDGYAAAGYLAIAPALFDRIEPGIELTYEGADMQKAFGLYGKLQELGLDVVLKDVAAGYHELAKTEKSIGVVGFCFGGLMSWISATRGENEKMQPACCVGYYAGGIGNFAAEEPSCPVMLHFGGDDTHIGKDQIDAVRNAHPEVEIYVYEGAQHGFNCDARGSFNPEAAKIAKERTLEFFKTHIA